MTLLFLTVLAGGVVLFVLFPIFARASEVSQRPTAIAQERKNLGEKKERLYEAIKDLDFEHQAGKLSETDYKSVRTAFVNQAAQVIARLDEIDEKDSAAIGQPEESAPESAPDAVRVASGQFCPSCELRNPAGAKFCMRCGSKLTSPANCPQCGIELLEEARFCTACGVAVPA